MSELLRLGSFLAFLALGVRVRAAAARRRAVNALLGYCVGLSLLAGVTQHDDWPFSSHTIAVGRPRRGAPICMTEFSGVDASGGEWRIDPYSWSPLYDSVLQFWFEQNYARLSSEAQRRTLAFLLEKAEAARERLVRGQRIGFERRLGPAASPYWLLLPRRPAAPTAYVGLRVYRACWTASEPAVGPQPRARTLLAEHRP